MMRTSQSRWGKGWVTLIVFGVGLISLLEVGGLWLTPVRRPYGEGRMRARAARSIGATSCKTIQKTGFFLDAEVDLQGADSDLEQRRREFACIGYLHSVERAWQMDHLRRLAWGRVSEVEGPQAFVKDVQMRILGIGNHALRITSGLSPETRALLESYSQGVNQGFASVDRSEVAQISDDERAQRWAWAPQDTIALLLLQAFDQTRKGFLSELDEQTWVARYGKEIVPWIVADQMPWDTSVLKPGEYSPGTGKRSKEKGDKPSPRTARVLLKNRPVAPLRGIFSKPLPTGSNNWVLDASRSSTGSAWLANDPHLSLVDPPFWHPLRLRSSRADLAGFTVAGIPTFPAGTNGRVGWGLTNSYLDAADLAAVKRSTGSNRQTEWVFIPVRLGKFRIPVGPIRVHRYSDRLPVLPIELEGASPEQDIVLRWSGYHLSPADLDFLFSITEARSAADADRRLAQVGLPSWNYVFGDQDGKVGYRAVGRIPRRLQAPQVGVSSLPKDQSPLEWDFKPSDFLTAEEMPHLFAPKRGFIVTANARQWPSDSHFHGGRAYAQAFRAQRIEELLSAQSQHDQSSLQKIQCDIFAQDAKLFVPVLLDALLGEQREGRGESLWVEHSLKVRQAMEVLMKWDFQTDEACRACGIYRNWMARLQANLGGVDEPFVYRWLRGLIENSGELEGFMRSPASRGILTASLEEALGELDSVSQQLGLQGSAEGGFPIWGQLHQARFSHLGGDHRALSRQSLSTPGDENTVNPGTAEGWNGGWDHRAGASMRMVIEFSKPLKMWAGLSGPRFGGSDQAQREKQWSRWRSCEWERVF